VTQITKNGAVGDEHGNLLENTSKHSLKPDLSTRRSKRVNLCIPIGISGIFETGEFTQEARTMNVSAHGALILLTTNIPSTPLITLTNRSTQEQQQCRVIYVNPKPDRSFEAALEFINPNPQFWRIAFPPDDWTGTNELLKPEALPLLPLRRKHEVKRISANPDNNPGKLTYAGFWLRLVAGMIDSLMLAAFLGALLFLTELVIKPDGTLTILAMQALIFLYFILMETSSLQATPGKMLLRLYVTDMTGRRITLSHSAIRTFLKYLSVITCGIGFLISAFTEQKQALYDVASKSLVLRHPRSKQE
jgi:uncharacterized RDD family membrane protein YckC